MRWSLPRRARRRALAPLAIAALALGCDGLPGRPKPDERAQPPSDVRDFATLYAHHCAGCHGADGTLGAARPLADPLYLAWAGDANVRRASAEGIPGSLMPGFGLDAGGPLDDEQLDALVRGLREHWGQEAPPKGLPPYLPSGPGNPARGETLFAARCAGCHGEGGEGGARGGPVTDPAYLSIVSDRALRAVVVAGRTDLGMPDYRAPADAGTTSLAARDVDDLVAWLASKRPSGAAAEGEERRP